MRAVDCVSASQFMALHAAAVASKLRKVDATPCRYRRHHVVRAAKDLHFNKNMEALKKMQAGADKLATVVGVTLGPKVRTAGVLAQ